MITGRAKQAQALRDRNLDLQDVLDSLDAAVVGLDAGGSIFYWNDHAQEVFGWHASEIVGRTLKEFVPDHIDPDTAADIFDRIENNKEWHGDLPVRRKDGTPIWTHSIFSSLHDDDGNIAGTITVSRDITHEKRLERERQRLLDIVEATPDLISFADLEGDVQYINRGGREMVGLSPDADITDKRIPDFSPAWANDIIRNEGLPTALEKGVWRGETAFLHQQTGEEIPISQIIIAHANPRTGEASHFSTVARDIRPLKEAEEALVQEKAQTEAVLKSLGEGLFVTDNHGRITMVNKAFEELTGWREDEVVGCDVADIIRKQNEEGESIPVREQIVNRVLAGEKIVAGLQSAYYLTDKSGRTFPVSAVVSPITVDGEIVGAAEVFRDITHEKEVDEAKTEFVSIASHQLRTPLTTVSWYAEMLLSGDAGDLTEEQRSYLREVYDSNRRMIDLVSALLNVSRIEMGTFAVETEPVDFNDLAREVVEELTPTAEEKQLTIQEEYDENIPAISTDRRLMRIVVQNLLSNAVKYTPVDGRVTISTAYRAAEEKVCISVADTGYGIPADQQDEVFTKLFRADNVKTRETDGTGLGLYITRAIIKMAGGTIDFESTEGEGTTFFVLLPAEGMPEREGQKQLLFTEVTPRGGASVNL